MQEPALNDAFRRLERSTPTEQIDLTAAALAEQLQREIDNRKTERFFWIFACSMLLYVFAVKLLDSSFAPLALFLLLIIFLIGIAAWQGVDTVVILLHRLFNRWMPEKPPKS
jgi:Mn2+/Fe2+ NRAMP family transporter